MATYYKNVKTGKTYTSSAAAAKAGGEVTAVATPQGTSSSSSSGSSSKVLSVKRPTESGGTIIVTAGGKVTERDASGKIISQYQADPNQTRSIVQQEGQTIVQETQQKVQANQQSRGLLDQSYQQKQEEIDKKYYESINQKDYIPEQFYKGGFTSLAEKIPFGIGTRIKESRLKAEQKAQKEAELGTYQNRVREAQKEALFADQQLYLEQKYSAPIITKQSQLQEQINQGTIGLDQANKELENYISSDVQPGYSQSMTKLFEGKKFVETGINQKKYQIPTTKDFLLSRKIASSVPKEAKGKTTAQYFDVLEKQGSPVTFKIGDLQPGRVSTMSSFGKLEVGSSTYKDPLDAAVLVGSSLVGAKIFQTTIGVTSLIPKAATTTGGLIVSSLAAYETTNYVMRESAQTLLLGKEGRELQKKYGSSVIRDIASLKTDIEIEKYGQEKGFTQKEIYDARVYSGKQQIPELSRLFTGLIAGEASANVVGSFQMNKKYGLLTKSQIGKIPTWQRVKGFARSRLLAGGTEAYMSTASTLEYERPSGSFDLAGYNFTLSAKDYLPSYDLDSTNKKININLGTRLPALASTPIGALSAASFAGLEGATFNMPKGSLAVGAAGYILDPAEYPGDVFTPLFFPKSFISADGITTKSATKGLTYTIIRGKSNKDNAVRLGQITQFKSKDFTLTDVKLAEFTKGGTNTKQTFTSNKDFDFSKGFNVAKTKQQTKIKDITISKSNSRQFLPSLTKSEVDVPTKTFDILKTKQKTKINLPSLSSSQTFTTSLTTIPTTSFSLTNVMNNVMTDTRVDTRVNNFVQSTVMTPKMMFPLLPLLNQGGGGYGYGKRKKQAVRLTKYQPNIASQEKLFRTLFKGSTVTSKSTQALTGIAELRI